MAILACVVDVKGKKKAMDTIPIVNEFPNVFSKDLLGVPSTRGINFGIVLEPGSGPISKALYRMAPTKLKELKVQL